MSLPNSMLLAIQETHDQLKRNQSLSLSIENRFREAAKLMKEHWFIIDEDQMFRCAVGAILLDATPEEKVRIEAEMRMLKAVSAAAEGVPVNLDQVLNETQELKPYGLLGIWRGRK